MLATHHCHWIWTTRPGLILTSQAPGRGLRLPSLRLRPTPPVPPGPLRTSVTRWGTDGHGSAGLPEISEDRAESVLLYVFYVCEAVLCFSLHRNCGVQSDPYRSSLTTHLMLGRIDKRSSAASAVSSAWPNIVSLCSVMIQIIQCSDQHDWRRLCTSGDVRHRSDPYTQFLRNLKQSGYELDFSALTSHFAEQIYCRIIF